MKIKKPLIEIGQEIKVREWRDKGKMLNAKITGDLVWVEDTDFWEIDIIYENGDEHYAVWDGDEWMSGEL